MGKNMKKTAIIPKLPTSAMNSREKHNVYCRRGYYSILKRIEELKAQVEDLEKKRETLLNNVQILQLLDHYTKNEKVIQLINYKIQLEEEAKGIHVRLKQYQYFREKIYGYQYQLQPQVLYDKTFNSNKSSKSIYLQKISHPPPLRRLLRSEDCHILAQKQYLAYCDFMESNETTSTGASLFGWRDRVDRLRESYIQYSFAKVFPQCQAASLSELAYEMVVTPESSRRLFSGYIVPKYNIIQIVDANNAVMFISYWTQDMKLVKHGAVVVSRFEIQEGEYIVLYCPLSRDWFIPVDRNKEDMPWGDFYLWLHIKDTDKGCETSMSGKLMGYGKNITKYWFMEILFVVLRWENIHISPILSLPTDG